MKTLGSEPRVGHDCATEATDADQDDGPGTFQPEDPREILHQIGHAVATPLLTESPKVAEVLPDLRWRDAERFSKLLRAHDLCPIIPEAADRAQIMR